ncbi:39S ribosomal protein L52, mitochondrial [Portunus trituberculatus]|uniref:Large ribosomal subunit protein mL52 n=1 Tax=Portunus trituberculatus TaxID=210409 RepID=A0A5B7CH52_PORTR|nr:39S ribosomal protein L52, mitochondrial [Portunus trituberculatus]
MTAPMHTSWNMAPKNRPYFNTSSKMSVSAREGSIAILTNLGAHGPLIDGPDYTFLDGRPTPLRIGQIRRARAQREAATKVVQLMSEVQFAIQREKQLKQEQEDTRQQTIASKLKAKGHKMLQDQENNSYLRLLLQEGDNPQKW